MKRVIKATSGELDKLDKFAIAIADINEAVVDYFVHQGYSKSEAHDYFKVESKELDNGIEITVRAELSYEELYDLSEELNKIVQELDSQSYFEPVQPGILQAIVYAAGEEQDLGLYSYEIVKPIIKKVLLRLNKAIDEKLELDDLYIDESIEDSNFVDIWVFTESDNYHAYTKVEVDKRNADSERQVNEELSNILYTSLLRNLTKD